MEGVEESEAGGMRYCGFGMGGWVVGWVGGETYQGGRGLVLSLRRPVGGWVGGWIERMKIAFLPCLLRAGRDLILSLRMPRWVGGWVNDQRV